LPDNMTMSGNINNVGSRVALRCPPGHEPVGSSVVTCTENGTWSPISLNCTMAVTECTPLVLPDNMAMDVNITDVGSQVAVSCLAGYEPEDAIAIVTCTENGTWSPISLNCTKAVTECTPLVLPDNMAMAMDVNTTDVGSQVAVSCLPGYEPEDAIVIVTCTENGTWTPFPDTHCTKVCLT